MLLDALSVQVPGDVEGNTQLMLGILECLPRANQVRGWLGCGVFLSFSSVLEILFGRFGDFRKRFLMVWLKVFVL